MKKKKKKRSHANGKNRDYSQTKDITRLKRRLTIIHKIQDLHFLIDSLILDYIDQDIRLSPVIRSVFMTAHV